MPTARQDARRIAGAPSLASQVLLADSSVSSSSFASTALRLRQPLALFLQYGFRLQFPIPVELLSSISALSVSQIILFSFRLVIAASLKRIRSSMLVSSILAAAATSSRRLHARLSRLSQTPS